MNKKILVGLIGTVVVLLVGGVLAQIALNVEPADFEVPEKEPDVRHIGTITFTVNGEGTGECYLDEPNMDIDDDFEQCLEDGFAGQRITDAEDWTGRPYLENEKGVRSFDINKLIEQDLNEMV